MQDIVKLSKIFSDINRVKIVALILRDKEVCVCEICDTLQLSQPLVSRHLKQMKAADILCVEKRGKWMLYSLIKTPHPLLACWSEEIKKHIKELPQLVVCETK